MGILDRLFRRNLSVRFINDDSISNIPYSPIQQAAVFACVRVLSETVASLPVFLYRRLPNGGKEKASEHPLFDILHNRPNPEMTSFEFREMLMGHTLLRGNFYAEVETDSKGNIIALWPLNPDSMFPVRKNGEVFYEYYLPDGNKKVFLKDQIFHVKAFSEDGLKGVSILKAAKSAIELAQAAETYGISFFKNSARPSGVLIYPGRLSEQAKENLRKSFTAQYSGLSKAHRIMVLEEGMRWEQIGISPDDAQFLEIRKFQIEEIARIFRVPPHLIGHLERSTYSNIEQQSIEFVVHTVRPWLVRIEQAINNQLLIEKERKAGYFAEFKVDGLLRGDIESRYRAYSIARQYGWMSANEIRELENLNPLPPDIGDTYWVPLNMSAERKAHGFEERRLPEPTAGEGLETEEPNYRKKHKLMKSYMPVMQEFFERAIRKEKNDVIAILKKLYRAKSITDPVLKTELDKYYREHAKYLEEKIKKPLTSIAKGASAAVEDEVGQEIEISDDDMRVQSYRVIRKHIARRRARIATKVERALENNRDVLAEVERDFDDLEEQANFEGHFHTVDSFNAFSYIAYGIAGIASLVWRNVGETCEICQELDGFRVSYGTPFVQSADNIGDEFEAAEAKLHPPLHKGCDCILSAEVL
jgi:HK97 family phage portal protein